MRNIYVRLPDDALAELRDLAERELRGTKEQAAYLILDGLQRRASEKGAQDAQRSPAMHRSVAAR